LGDSFAMLSGVTSDAVITSLPWAVPAWDRNRWFSAEDLCGRQKGELAGILEMARKIAPVVVLLKPKTIHMTQIVVVSKDNGFGRLEIEHVSVEGWKNFSNAVLYLEKLCEAGGVIEVLLNLKSVVTPQRPYA
jgi:hypothetical protein